MILILCIILAVIALYFYLSHKLLIKLLFLHIASFILMIFGALCFSGYLFLGIAILFRLIQISRL